MHTNLNRVALAALVATLAGCGGGGGDSGSGSSTVTVPAGTRSVTASGTADLTPANAIELGNAAADAVVGSGGESLAGIAGADAAGRARAAAAGAGQALAPLRWVRAALAGAAAPARMRPAAVSTDSQPCDGGGTLTITVDDVDNNQRLGAGDTISVTLFECSLGVGDPRASGAFRFSFNAVELDTQNNPVAFDASLRFTQFTVSGEGTLDGAARLWLRSSGGVETVRISYQRASLVNGIENLVYDFDVLSTSSAGNSRFELSGGLASGGATYSVVPVTAFESTGGNPPAVGVLELRDAAGDRLVITARSAQTYDLALFPAGALGAIFAQTAVPWTSGSSN